MNLQHLTELAINFRSALESVPVMRRLITLQQFPCGACGDAALLLGTYFIDMGYPPFDYICGKWVNKDNENWSFHAWLEREGLIVDITSDQFPDGPEKVIVCYSSRWHASLSGERHNIADFRIYDEHTISTLEQEYRKICFWLKEV